MARSAFALKLGIEFLRNPVKGVQLQATIGMSSKQKGPTFAGPDTFISMQTEFIDLTPRSQRRKLVSGRLPAGRHSSRQ